VIWAVAGQQKEMLVPNNTRVVQKMAGAERTRRKSHQTMLFFFNSSIPVSLTNSLSSSPPRFNRSDNNGRSNYQNNYQMINHQQYNFNGSQYHRSSPGGFSGSSSTASTPPNSSLFASSKCFDSPSPNELPQPPQHWLSCGIASIQSDNFSHNLKSMLNVKA